MKAATSANGLCQPPVLLARNAMNTRFEIAMHGGDPATLRCVGEEALDEIERMEDCLSLFRPASEIAHLNACAATESVRVSAGTFSLLRQIKHLHSESGGAFDPTIAPLLHCWGLLGGNGRVPSTGEISAARACVGMDFVELDENESAARFTRLGVRLDLGAIGKGAAIDCAAEILRDAGVTSALIHGGTSTVFAVGSPPDGDGWPVAIDGPPVTPGERRQTLAVVRLRDESLSVSAVWGKSFTSGGRTFGHVINPITGLPASETLIAAVVLPSATDTDALSTALLVLGRDGQDRLAAIRPEIRTLVAWQSQNDRLLQTDSIGIFPQQKQPQAD